MEDRILYSGVALAAELLATEGTGAAGQDPQADGTLTGDSTNPNSFSGWITSDSHDSNSDSIAQLEASLQGLDALLAELAALESQSQIAQEDTTGDPFLNLVLVSDPDNEDLANEESISDSLPRSTSIARSNELIVIDAAVPDYEALVSAWQLDQGSDREFTVLLEDRSVNGVEFISEFLAGTEQQYSAIHLVTHGDVGVIQLGSAAMTEATLSDYGTQFDVWRSSLNEDADLLLYGCSIAEGSQGLRFVSRLADLLSVDIAASSDLTGASSLGGDWDLEYRVGRIDASILTIAEDSVYYPYLLNNPPTAAPIIETFDDFNLSGWDGGYANWSILSGWTGG